MTLTPGRVRAVTFDRAPLGKRGYHEDQVDDFLDLVEAALTGATRLTPEDVRKAVFDSASLVRRGYDEDQVDAFLDTVVATLESPESGETEVFERVPVEAGQEDGGDPVPPPPDSDVPFLPLPPAPPGVRGYRPGDVARLSRLLSSAATDHAGASADDLSRLRMNLTFFVGQGYDPRAVDALVAAWTVELRRREG